MGLRKHGVGEVIGPDDDTLTKEASAQQQQEWTDEDEQILRGEN